MAGCDPHAEIFALKVMQNDIAMTICSYSIARWNVAITLKII